MVLSNHEYDSVELGSNSYMYIFHICSIACRGRHALLRDCRRAFLLACYSSRRPSVLVVSLVVAGMRQDI